MIRAVFFTFLLAISVQCESPTIRQTRNGPVEGLEQTSSLGQKYYAFKGIPYAEPPITGQDPYTGEQVDRRFKSPKPLKHRWTETMKAHNDGKPCIQLASISEIPSDSLSEDCLILNIYVPVGGAERKTVLISIHGGAFVMGDAADQFSGPDFLLSEDNIVVKIQYRLGIFGFLNLNHGEYTGNMALKDQQLALKWVFENIENFSGNKDEILLFGGSAGGASVHYQMVNEESRKYFKRAFALSSSAFSSYAMRKADHLPQIQECTQIYDKDELISYLKTANSSAFDTCYPWKFPGELDIKWVPTIESPSTKDPFLSKRLEDIYDSDSAPILDVMFSFASKEAITFLPNLLEMTEPLLKPNSAETNVKLPFEGFTKDAYPNEYAEAVEKLRLAYFPDTTSVDAIKRGNAALMSDLMFSDGILKAVVLQTNANNKNTSKNGPKNTFLYRFSVNSDLNLMRAFLQKKFDDTTHGDEVCYLFQCHIFDHVLNYDKHFREKNLNYDIIKRTVKIITNFARTGNPSIEGDAPFKSCRSTDEIFCQEISNEPNSRTISDIKKQLNYNAWREVEEIYDSLNISPQKSSEPRTVKEEL